MLPMFLSSSVTFITNNNEVYMTFFNYFVIATVFYIIAVLVICRVVKLVKVYKSSHAVIFAISVVFWYLFIMIIYIWVSIQSLITLIH